MAELVKGRLNRGLQSNLYFWRDNTGNKVDVLAEQGEKLLPIEIKSGRMVTTDSFDALNKWCKLAGDIAGSAHLVYAGEDVQQRPQVTVLPWRGVAALAEKL